LVIVSLNSQENSEGLSKKNVAFSQNNHE